MVFMGTKLKHLASRRFLQSGEKAPYFKSEWMLNSDAENPSPHVYHIEMSPGMVSPVHFHKNDEFQIVIGGSGKIGPNEVKQGHVHFVSGYCPYGPLVAGSEGLEYFTIRSHFENGFYLIPQDNAKMIKSQRIQSHVDFNRIKMLKKLEGTFSSNLAFDSIRGMQINTIHLKPFDVKSAPDHTADGGQMFIVISGSMTIYNGDKMHKWEQVFITEDETKLQFIATEEGCEILQLQFPCKINKNLLDK